jgi:hypothetical protein
MTNPEQPPAGGVVSAAFMVLLAMLIGACLALLVAGCTPMGSPGYWGAGSNYGTVSSNSPAGRESAATADRGGQGSNAASDRGERSTASRSDRAIEAARIAPTAATVTVAATIRRPPRTRPTAARLAVALRATAARAGARARRPTAATARTDRTVRAALATAVRPTPPAMADRITTLVPIAPMRATAAAATRPITTIMSNPAARASPASRSAITSSTRCRTATASRWTTTDARARRAPAARRVRTPRGEGMPDPDRAESARRLRRRSQPRDQRGRGDPARNALAGAPARVGGTAALAGQALVIDRASQFGAFQGARPFGPAPSAFQLNRGHLRFARGRMYNPRHGPPRVLDQRAARGGGRARGSDPAQRQHVTAVFPLSGEAKNTLLTALAGADEPPGS